MSRKDQKLGRAAGRAWAESGRSIEAVEAVAEFVGRFIFGFDNPAMADFAERMPNSRRRMTKNTPRLNIRAKLFTTDGLRAYSMSRANGGGSDDRAPSQQTATRPTAEAAVRALLHR